MKASERKSPPPSKKLKITTPSPSNTTSAAFELCKKLKSSPNKNVLKQTLEALGNVMSSGLKACEHCVQSGTLEQLASITKDFDPDTLLAKSKVIKIFCQNYCIHLLPESAGLLLKCLFFNICNSNIDIVVYALDSIAYFNSQQTKDVELPQHVYDRFIQLLNHVEKHIQVSAYFAFGNIINCCHPKMQPQMICNTVNMMDVFLSNDDPSIKENALYFLIKTMEDVNDLNIPAKILPECVKLLDAKSFKLQQLAANLLEKLSGGTEEQINAILRLNPDNALIEILKSPCIDVRLAALRFLGNIFEIYLHGSEMKSIRLKISNSLLYLVNKKLSPNVTQHFGKILFLIFQDPQKEQNMVCVFFPCLLKFIMDGTNTDFIIKLLTGLSNALRNMPDTLYLFIEQRVVTRLVDLLKHDNVNVQNSALMVLDVISCQDKNHLISCGILKEIKKLFFEHPNEKINANGLLLLSKIANGGEKEIQAIFDEKDLVKTIFHIFKNEKFELQKEAANVFLGFINGNMEQLMEIINMGFLPVFFDFMGKCDGISAIPFLKAFCQMCKKAESKLNEIRQQINSNDRTTLFENLFKNGDEELRVIIYECINFLNLNLSLTANNLSLSDL